MKKEKNVKKGKRIGYVGKRLRKRNKEKKQGKGIDHGGNNSEKTIKKRKEEKKQGKGIEYGGKRFRQNNEGREKRKERKMDRARRKHLSKTMKENKRREGRKKQD